MKKKIRKLVRRNTFHNLVSSFSSIVENHINDINKTQRMAYLYSKVKILSVNRATLIEI